MLVKAFVQPDGSHGNGAGVVLLPGILHNETEHSHININSSRNEELENYNYLFPSDGDCFAIAKRVGLPETTFVLFLKNKKGIEFCENHSLPEGVDGTDGSNATAAADFHAKWYTPEREVDMCGHATVALAGYIHAMVTSKARLRAENDGIGERDSITIRQQRNSSFWKMQCKAGLLGIEVVDGVHNNIAPTAGVPNSKTAENGKTSKSNNDDGLLRFPRVVMEQASPEFCGIVDGREIVESLSIGVENDLAITFTGGNSEHDNRTNIEKTELVFPFAHCEIVSTGGRDLMIPVRSSVLTEMDILGDGSSSSNNEAIQRLCDNINSVSERYDIVGYHMFEVDDALFLNKHDSDTYNRGTIEMKPITKSTRNDESIKGRNTVDDSPIHLNELIRIFQMSKEKGLSGAESCLEAVMLEQDQQDDNGNDRKTTSATTAPIAAQSRIVLVTGIRNFAPFVGIPEEPATGSANGALACYLVKYFFLEALSLDGHPISFRFCMEQGRAMGEPCLIDAEIEVVNGTIRAVKVGGLVNVTGDSLDLDFASI
jgi:predicted PhzF superfamily epimerase YddE/YHI9